MSGGPFACLLVTSFLVWAWQREEPELAERELLVAEGGRVLAASARLRQLGVEPEQALERSRALAQESGLELEVRPHPGLRAELAWENALQQVNARTPWLESVRPGLAVARLEPGDTVGLPFRIGMGGDRSLAYLAALAAGEECLVVVPAGQEQAFREAFSVVRLQEAGVSQDTVQNMLWLGFPRLGDLARLNDRQVRARFPEGELLLELARGADRRAVPLYHPPPEATASLESLDPWEEPPEAALRHLLEEAAGILEGRRARWFTLILERPDGERRQARFGLHQATASLRRLWPPVQQLLLRLWEPGLEVERLQLALGGLVAPGRVQGSLWSTRSPRQVVARAAQVRCPGQLMTVDLHHPQAYLPEECWSFRRLGP